MKSKISFIALRATKVGDASMVLNAYSLEHGRISILSPVGKGRKGGARRVALMPMSVVECQGERRSGQEFYTISEPAALIPMGGVYGNPVKNLVALFLTEALTQALREQPADEALFSFLVDSVKALCEATTHGAANFHLAFLLRLSYFLGIEPDDSSYKPGYLFDMQEGVFRRPDAALVATSGEWVLSGVETEAMRRLLRMSYATMHLYRFSREQRNEILNRVLDYYTLHYAKLNSLASLEILRSM